MIMGTVVVKQMYYQSATLAYHSYTLIGFNMKFKRQLLEFN